MIRHLNPSTEEGQKQLQEQGIAVLAKACYGGTDTLADKLSAHIPREIAVKLEEAHLENKPSKKRYWLQRLTGAEKDVAIRVMNQS